MYIDKISTLASIFCSDDPARDSITGALITDTKTVATDGKVLIEIEHPKVNGDDFPIGDTTIKNLSESPVIIRAQALKEAGANIPKLNKTKTFPILQNIKIGRREGDKVCMVTNDLEQERTVQCKPIDAVYPKYEQVYPLTKPVLTIHLMVDKLKKLVQVMEKVDKNAVLKFEFYEENKPVKFSHQIKDGRHIQGMIMTCKI